MRLSVTGNSRHVLLTSAVTAQPSVTLLTLSLSGGSTGFSLAAGQTLTLSDGGILKTGGGTATIGGGAGISTTGEYVLRTDTASDQLTIATPLGGGTGLTKSGLGTLVLGVAGNSYGGADDHRRGHLEDDGRRRRFPPRRRWSSPTPRPSILAARTRPWPASRSTTARSRTPARPRP